MTLRLDAGAADLVASGHEQAASTIDSAATSAPDAREGTCVGCSML